jgi:hypothetical protein
VAPPFLNKNMKKKLMLILGLFAAAVIVNAVDIKLGWDLNPVVEGVEKYVIYQAKGTNGVFSAVVTVPGTTNVGSVKGLAPGLYRFVVVSQNSVGTAPPSNEVSWPTNTPTATKSVILLEVK